jgi:hypothetical protein
MTEKNNYIRCFECGFYYINRDEHIKSSEHLNNINDDPENYDENGNHKKIFYKCGVCYGHYMKHHYNSHIKSRCHLRKLELNKNTNEIKNIPVQIQPTPKIKPTNFNIVLF